jgi:hypothetical protein
VYRNEEGRKICGEREGGGVWVTGWQCQRGNRERGGESEATTVKRLERRRSHREGREKSGEGRLNLR